MQKFGRRHTKPAAQGNDCFQQWLALAALKQTDLSAVQAADLGKLLLGQAALGANATQDWAELVSWGHASANCRRDPVRGQDKFGTLDDWCNLAAPLSQTMADQEAAASLCKSR